MKTLPSLQLLNFVKEKGFDQYGPIQLKLKLEKIGNKLSPDDKQIRYFKCFIGKHDVSTMVASLCNMSISQARDTMDTVIVPGAGMDMAFYLQHKVYQRAYDEGYPDMFDPQEYIFEKQISEKERIAQLKEAGRWDISPDFSFSKVPPGFADTKGIAYDRIGNVEYGNASFEISAKFDDEDKIYQISCFKLYPTKQCCQDFDQTREMVFDLESVNFDSSESDYLANQVESNFLPMGKFNALTNEEEFKSLVVWGLEISGFINYKDIEAYRNIKEHGTGYFRQLDKAIHLPASLGSKDKLSPQEIKQLIKFYTPAKRVSVLDAPMDRVTDMVVNGFSNSQIYMICNGVNKIKKGYFNNVLEKYDKFRSPEMAKLRDKWSKKTKGQKTMVK